MRLLFEELNTSERLKSVALKNDIEKHVGTGFGNKPLCVQVTEYVKSQVPEVTIIKQFACITLDDMCLFGVNQHQAIMYQDIIYDFTPGQYSVNGVTATHKDVPILLTRDETFQSKVSDIFGEGNIAYVSKQYNYAILL